MDPILPNKPPEGYVLSDIGILISNIINMALAAAGLVAVIYLVIGAFQYFTAYGDESKAESAKKTITWAIIGLVVIILARVAVGELFRFFGGITPGIPVGPITPANIP